MFTHSAFNRSGNSIGAFYLVIEEKVGQDKSEEKKLY